MSDSCVYIHDKLEAWLPATVIHQEGNKVQVKVFSVAGDQELGTREISLLDYPNQTLPLQNVDAAGHLMEMADMVDLPSLHEVRCLENSLQYIYIYNSYTNVQMNVLDLILENIYSLLEMACHLLPSHAISIYYTYHNHRLPFSII